MAEDARPTKDHLYGGQAVIEGVMMRGADHWAVAVRRPLGDIHLELCSACHPFYTGRQKLVDTGGRVERFQRRYAKSGGAQQPPA